MQCLTDLRKAQTQLDALVVYAGCLQVKRGSADFRAGTLMAAAEACVRAGVALPMTNLKEMAANREIMHSIDSDNAESLRFQLQYDPTRIPEDKKATAPYGISDIDLPEGDRITIQENVLVRTIGEAMRVRDNTSKVSLI